MKRFLVVLLALVAIGSLLGNLLMYRRYSTNRPVVSMKDGGITIKDYRDALEFSHGKEVLTKMVLSRVIHDAAKKAGVMPTQADIDRRIAFLKRRKPELLAPALNDPAKMREFVRGLETDIALENLTVQGIEVTDAEVAAFYQRARAVFTMPDQTEMTIVSADNSTDARNAEQLLSKGVDPATIASQPRLKVEGLTTRINFKAMSQKDQDSFKNKVRSMPKGSVFMFIPSGNTADKNIIVRINEQKRSGTPPLSEVKDDAKTLCLLAKAASQGKNSQKHLMQLYKDAGIRFESEKYNAYFAEINQAMQQSGG